MARERQAVETRRRRRPATTPEARERELADAAYDLAEDQIRGGTASSQVITHFLKMGSTRERLEQERLRYEAELAEVKMENLRAQTRVEELYINALDAMRGYSGQAPQLEEGEHHE